MVVRYGPGEGAAVLRLSRCLLVLACLSLAACNTAGQGVTGSMQGSTGIRLANPDSTKWVVAQASGRPQPSNVRIWVCRPLACSGFAGVGISSQRSPTRNPDRKALEKAAKLLATQTKAEDMMVDAASEGDERLTPLSSRVTEVRGYPAIIAETKRTSRGKASYTMRGELFIGAMLVKMMSVAPDRDEAKRHFDSFVAAMEINDVDPSAAPAASPAPSAPVAVDSNAPTAVAAGVSQ